MFRAPRLYVAKSISFHTSVTHLPRHIGEHILPAEAVYPGRLREEPALPVENAVPRVEQHVTAGVHDRQLAIRYPYDRVQVLNSAKKNVLPGSNVVLFVELLNHKKAFKRRRKAL